MKAISIRQPYIWAILDIPEGDCPKRVENRKATAFNYRGPVLLHASAGGTRREFADAVEAIGKARRDHGFVEGVDMGAAALTLDAKALPRGCFLGIARIVAAVMHPATFGLPEDLLRGQTRGYRIAGQLGLQLANVRKLPRVDAPGQLGLYNVEHWRRHPEPKPGFIDFGEHAAAYADAWAELAAMGAV